MIKKTFCLLAIGSLVLVTSCKENATSKIKDTNLEDAQEHVNDAKHPIMKFETNDHDFGVINEGDKVETVFKFKNEGDSELVITTAKGSCGCTVPDYPKDPIKPGDTGEIKVSFDSNGKPGQQQKSVIITTNTTTGSEKLNIKATVNPKTKK